MKGAVIGLGKMGLVHYGILNSLKGVEIVACCEKEKLVVNNLQKYTNVNVYENHSDLIKKEDLDFVFVTTPLSSHIPIARSCLEKEVNFFIEKPLGINSQETIQFCKKLNISKIIHAVGYCKRFIPTFQKAKELLEDRVLDDIVRINGTMYVSQLFSTGMGWRYDASMSGGGVMMDLGAHLLDMLLWYFGPIEKVQGQINSYYSKNVEDFAHSLITFKSNLEGFVDLSWSVPGYRLPELSITTYGKNGMFTVTEDYLLIYLKERTSKLEAGYTKLYRQDLDRGVEIDIAGPEFTREDLHFLDSIKNNKQTTINAFEAAKVQCVIDAIYQSAKNQKIMLVDYG